MTSGNRIQVEDEATRPALPRARFIDEEVASCAPSESSTTTSLGGRADFVRVTLDTLGADALSTGKLSRTATELVDIHTRAGLAGIALHCTDSQSSDQLDDLLEKLHSQGVPILLLAEQNCDIWSSANLSFLAGVIVENACILPSGERRDYFRSRQLRELMAWCAQEREVRPEFFIGFLELWEQRPHPSVVRRGVKLAEHFGAIIEHGPARPEVVLPSAIKGASQTLSGFEYLRRAPIIEVSFSYATRRGR